MFMVIITIHNFWLSVRLFVYLFCLISETAGPILQNFNRQLADITKSNLGLLYIFQKWQFLGKSASQGAGEVVGNSHYNVKVDLN